VSIDAHPRFGDDVGIGAEPRQLLPEGRSRVGAPAHRLERPLGLADRAHAMMDAPRPEPSLGDLEAAPAAEHERILRHAHVAKTDMHVAMRRVVVAIDLHRP
jgi:hypothetical protein